MYYNKKFYSFSDGSWGYGLSKGRIYYSEYNLNFEYVWKKILARWHWCRVKSEPKGIFDEFVI